MKKWFALVVLAAPMVAYGQQSLGSTNQKDPGTATIISVIVPGGGQMYSGKIGKGLGILALGYGSFIAGSYLAVRSVNSCIGDANCGTKNMNYLYAGVAAGTAAWIYGIVTAAGDARAMNARARLTVVPVGKSTGVGLAIAF